MLIGVHIDASGEIARQLIPFPQYTCPTDGVCMLHIATASNGRIFAGGSDGGLYEARRPRHPRNCRLQLRGSSGLDA